MNPAQFSEGDIPAFRAALYAPSGSRDLSGPNPLVTCARRADAAGLRVVAMVGDDDASQGLGGPNLRDLVCRLGQGEFEVIIAHSGGAVITIGSAMGVIQ